MTSNTFDGSSVQARRVAQLTHSVTDYRHSKASPFAVHCPSASGYKTTAGSLAEQAGGRWVHRAGGYLVSQRQLNKFRASVAQALAEVEADQATAPAVSTSAVPGSAPPSNRILEIS